MLTEHYGVTGREARWFSMRERYQREKERQIERERRSLPVVMRISVQDVGLVSGGRFE